MFIGLERLTLVAGVGILVLTGCSGNDSPEPSPLTISTSVAPALNVAEACTSLEGVMHRADLMWPIASQKVSGSAAKVLLKGFESVAAQTTGDLRITLKAWNQGFSLLSPYLVANDPGGAAKATNAVQEEKNLLANTNLATFCGW